MLLLATKSTETLFLPVNFKAGVVRDGPFFLPYLTGERTPHNDPNIRGAFYGLGPNTTNAQAMRAVVEAIAYSFCDANDCLKHAGTEVATISAIGGGTRSDFVLQTMADAMGVVIQRNKGSATGPALGAARLAMISAGTHTLEEVMTKPELDAEFEPRTEYRSHHLEKLSRWRDLYATLKPYAGASSGPHNN